jgi:hypothetical protein
MSKPLTEQELHILAMNHVANDLNDLGFKFISINSELKKNPQFVCLGEDDQYYFIIVRVVKLPLSPYKYDVVWMEKVKKHAHKRNAKVLYAGVGLGHADDEDLPVSLDQDYLLEYTGIQSAELILN